MVGKNKKSKVIKRNSKKMQKRKRKTKYITQLFKQKNPSENEQIKQIKSSSMYNEIMNTKRIPEHVAIGLVGLYNNGHIFNYKIEEGKIKLDASPLKDISKRIINDYLKLNSVDYTKNEIETEFIINGMKIGTPKTEDLLKSEKTASAEETHKTSIIGAAAKALGRSPDIIHEAEEKSNKK
ncbi:MAG: hypothetical protein QXE90_03340 [Candidatus Micrarchaeia archaeon]